MTGRPPDVRGHERAGGSSAPGALEQLASYLGELLARLAEPRARATPPEDAELARVPTEATDARDLLAYVDARWHPVSVARHGGRKRRRPSRLKNAEGSITVLASAWATETGRTRSEARRLLRLLARSGLIVREPSGAGYAWRLAPRRGAAGTVAARRPRR